MSSAESLPYAAERVMGMALERIADALERIADAQERMAEALEAEERLDHTLAEEP